MPVDSVKRSIHIRRRKNEVIFRNIARLWDLGRSAQSHQEILDGLHPWNAPISLRFENLLPRLLAVAGVLTALPVFFQAAHFWAQLCLLAGLLMIFWAYISYENDDPVQEVIAFLEKESIAKKYQLAFGRQPQHLSIPLNPLHFAAHLKRLFPVFNQGSLSNDISNYATLGLLSNLLDISNPDAPSDNDLAQVKTTLQQAISDARQDTTLNNRLGADNRRSSALVRERMRASW